MAVYEESEITQALIEAKFPTVASAIVASAGVDQVEITADAISEGYPEIVAQFEKVGFDAGMAKGIDTENERVASLDSISAVGYEKIIKDAKLDKTSTANDVKIKVFDEQQKTKANIVTGIQTDASEVAKAVADMGGQNVDENDVAKEGENLMAQANKNVRGEK